MTKFLVFIVVIWVLARLAKRWILHKAQTMQQNLEAQLRQQMGAQMGAGMGAGMGQQAAGKPAPYPADEAANSHAERMLACAQCGLHVPQSEAVMRAGQPYCCTAHAPQ
jgi:hypothetical protein